jgi:transcriptional regulator GlxA family with amidase domain
MLAGGPTADQWPDSHDAPVYCHPVHSIAVLAEPDVIAFDLAIALETFGRVRLASGEPGYRVRVCGCEPVVAAGPIGITTEFGLDELADADTIIVPGRNDVSTEVRDDVVVALKAAHSNGIRIASICTGAFTLAAAGILDGKRATTHWLAAEAFAAAHPGVRLDADALYVDEGELLTSAGASAGLDLCLHMVARDYGSAVAADAARMAVTPLHRTGGQAQFIVRNRRESNTELDGVLAWIENNAHLPLTLDDIARHASTSVRTLNRSFKRETGQTPMQWVNGVRIRHAQELLEATDDGIESISRRVGFTSATNFREQFRRLAGVSPQNYRTIFNDRSGEPVGRFREAF